MADGPCEIDGIVENVGKKDGDSEIVGMAEGSTDGNSEVEGFVDGLED